MSVINVRKARAGTDSAGHRWPVDGAVIEVPVEHALALTRIPDGGFSIIETTDALDQRDVDAQDEAGAPEPGASVTSTSAPVADQRAARRKASVQPSTI